MTRRVLKTDTAEEDALEIGSWIAGQSSVDAALKWLSSLDDKFRKLAETPGQGTDQSRFSPGLRSSPFGNYLVFFQKVRGGVRIVRIIHGARDYRQLLEDLTG